MSPDLTTIATFAKPPEAEAAQNALAHEGIKSYVEFISWAWYLSNAAGGVQLLVARDNAQRAAEILGLQVSTDGQTPRDSAEEE